MLLGQQLSQLSHSAFIRRGRPPPQSLPPKKDESYARAGWTRTGAAPSGSGGSPTYAEPVTRIVGGALGGRRLLVPPGRGTRPTSERAREGLFNTLSAVLDLRGAAFADLYAGSGAVGLEAASRGAGRVLLVESDHRAAGIVRRNAANLTDNAADKTADKAVRVLTTAVERVAATAPAGGPYDVVFADPPYRESDEQIDALLESLSTNGWLAENAVLVVERDRRSREPVWPAGVDTMKSRGYGEATLWYGQQT